MITKINNNDYIIIQITDESKPVPIGIAEASLLPGEGMYYFNRLFVNPNYRKKKYGKKLLNTLLDYIDSIDAILCLDINPYGEMTYEQLKMFYMSHGFKETDNYRLLYKAGGRSNE